MILRETTFKWSPEQWEASLEGKRTDISMKILLEPEDARAFFAGKLPWRRERNSLTKLHAKFHMENEGHFLENPSQFTKVQHDLCQDWGVGCECIYLRMSPAVWPSLEVHQETFKVSFRLQSCPLQEMGQLPSAVERMKTCTASWSCPILVCLISVIPFKNQPVTVLGR